MHRTAKRLRSLAALTVVLLTLALAPAMAHAAGTRPFSITITHVECVDSCDAEGLEAAFEGHADFFAKVFVNGVEHRTPTIDNNSSVDPFWAVPVDLPDTVENVPVTIQIWDEDDAPGGDDLGDDSPHDDDNNLDFTVHYQDGKWRDTATNPTDNVNWPQSCSTGDGDTGSDEDEPRVKVCWEVSTLSTSGDADGDGLLDGWERNGYNDDGDGTIDVDLPALGADPRHKDLYLELDSEAGRAPSREGIEALRRAFAAAPITAGSTAGTRPGGVSAPPNPDGRPGITLHIDTGGVYDPTATEGGVAGTCSDGIDNGGDGRIDGNDPSCNRRLVNYLDSSIEQAARDCGDGIDNDGDALPDAQDPDCRAGENLGGGSILATRTNACGIDNGDLYYTAKAANFNRERRLIFRYGVMAVQPAGCPRVRGGQGEIGGNDFAVFNPDAGSIMHEFGHNLNLRHGGFQDRPNCKPNYVSLMNYDLAAGIPRVGGGVLLDYSPPRINVDGTSRGAAPLADLVETNLTEPTPLDPTDPRNRFRFVDRAGQKLTDNLDTGPNWNSDTDPPFETALPTNIDTAGPGPVRTPAACIANTSTDETIHGSDDWTAVSLPFRQFGDSADAGINVESDDYPTTAELLAMEDQANKADLELTVTDDPDPVAAGTDLTWTAVVTNHGPNPAAAVSLSDTLPAQTPFVAADPACKAAAGTVTCGLGDLRVGASRTVTITAHVPADLVHDAGGPVALANQAVADNLVGPDPDAGNDGASTTTTVVAVADLAVSDFVAQAPPTQLVIGGTLDVTLHGTVASNGPSSPMDATLTTAAAPDPGATVTPASSTRSVPALAVGAPRTADSTFTVGCDRPGAHTYRFTASVTPARPGDTDPVEADNHRPVEFTLDCIVPVRIDIEPEGGLPTPVVVPRGVTTVAVLTTAAGEYGLPLAFDAASVQVPTVRFGPRQVVYAGPGGSTEPHPAGHLADVVERTVNPVEAVDGDLDLVLHFDTEPSGVRAGDTEVCVKGSYTDRAAAQTYRFFGCRAVRVLPF
ncbi:hypothetical protein GCM10018781_58500 [Kitasatospora indigofera]|uniref:DUF11 domain-containing protein n=1 Tax=Kitasatospora indigofera TaxID=67307 RepID=A0A919G7W6_9ACTN|nr:DUF11 domain-containing protein [Kitasatospora indigofera]GHH79742.1 hypothetical protein GCM10018781_58500 [Kitasatospora indigofera]